MVAVESSRQGSTAYSKFEVQSLVDLRMRAGDCAGSVWSAIGARVVSF
jgi:hypothetical protein